MILIADSFLNGHISMKYAARFLDKILGYTRQERRKIISGWYLSKKYMW